jgi:hypothetical protein
MAGRFADLALACVHREYPNHVMLWLNGDDDAQPPRKLHPAFYGCLDWHSSVHGHWMLVRLLQRFPDAPFAARARAALDESLTGKNIAGEVAYFDAPGRVSFERPYGLAWLLALDEELRAWDDPDAKRWASSLAPLRDVVAARIESWLPKLGHPIRIGEHAQTAFAFGLILDWARATGDARMAKLVAERSRTFYADDRDCPLAYEPSGQDFLSPCLGEADLMRRVMAPAEYARWLSDFLPQVPVDGDAGWLGPAVSPDPSDPKLAHLDGLNLSRAWMLEGMAAGLPADDKRRPALLAAAQAHAKAGLESVTGEHYEGGHWLGSFATYLMTGRGLPGGGS